ncbi:HAD-IA family hydrolase [Aquamicrobium sp. LC103]|uniref:HAD-IIA family hydrolase n=1 Tax=Aquamicrobium sp. LC103 TaxID=1120658 RepID=UPI0009E1C4B1|nr:HAD-IA family hydrolase [Aquamicrobium sp. LC103]TKT78286.1 haloacid dehalogenase [Aquamicrobium sp. LC103]
MQRPETVSSFAEIDLADRSAILCDLDGCLLSSGHVYDGARDFVRACGDRLWIVSNNSSDTSATLAARLVGLGLPILADRILLAGEQTLRFLAQDQSHKALAVYVDAPLRTLAKELGLTNGSATPEIVVMGRDRCFGLGTLEELAAHVVDGAELWAANLDLSHPAATGYPVPETGALLRAVEACAGPFAVRSIGKPAPDLIEIALARSGVERTRAVFIGDNLATDGEAARAAGVAFIRIVHPPVSSELRTDNASNGAREWVAC